MHARRGPQHRRHGRESGRAGVGAAARRGGGGLRAAVGTYAPAAPTPTVVTAPASLHSFGTTSFTGLRRPGCYALGSMGVRVALGTGCNRVSLIGRAWRNARVSSSLISFVRFAPNQITIPVITVPVTRPGSGLRGCGYKFHSVEPILLGWCASDHDSSYYLQLDLRHQPIDVLFFIRRRSRSSRAVSGRASCSSAA